VIALRAFTGGVGGFLAGLVVQWTFSVPGREAAADFAVLFGISGLSFAVALGLLAGLKERSLPIEPREIDVEQQLKRAPLLLKADREYRRYVLVRAASTGIQLASPFYIIYATEVLGVPPAAAGIYISVGTLAKVLSNLVWARLCARRGNLWVLRLSCALGVGAPSVAILLSLLAQGANLGSAISLFGAVFFVEGLAVSAFEIGQRAYLYDIAPEGDRPTYFGLSNTLLGPLYFAPAAGGALLDVVGYVPIFGVAALLLVVAFVLTWRLGRETRQRRISAGTV
jgi:Na+/melibiose symporter-like transporter